MFSFRIVMLEERAQFNFNSQILVYWANNKIPTVKQRNNRKSYQIQVKKLQIFVKPLAFIKNCSILTQNSPLSNLTTRLSFQNTAYFYLSAKYFSSSSNLKPGNFLGLYTIYYITMQG